MKKAIKVIKILSEYKVIINAGSRDGIEINEKFDIVSSEKIILEDPDTHEILDEFEAYKAVVIAKDVREKYTICETPRYAINPVGSALAGLSSINNSIYGLYETSEVKQKKLNVSEYDIHNILEKYNDDSPVIVGDHVIKIEK